jgi:hypothetical protein
LKDCFDLCIQLILLPYKLLRILNYTYLRLTGQALPFPAMVSTMTLTRLGESRYAGPALRIQKSLRIIPRRLRPAGKPTVTSPAVWQNIRFFRRYAEGKIEHARLNFLHQFRRGLVVFRTVLREAQEVTTSTRSPQTASTKVRWGTMETAITIFVLRSVLRALISASDTAAKPINSKKQTAAARHLFHDYVPLQYKCKWFAFAYILKGTRRICQSIFCIYHNR